MIKDKVMIILYAYIYSILSCGARMTVLRINL